MPRFCYACGHVVHLYPHKSSTVHVQRETIYSCQIIQRKTLAKLLIDTHLSVGTWCATQKTIPNNYPPTRLEYTKCFVEEICFALRMADTFNRPNNIKRSICKTSVVEIPHKKLCFVLQPWSLRIRVCLIFLLFRYRNTNDVRTTMLCEPQRTPTNSTPRIKNHIPQLNTRSVCHDLVGIEKCLG